MKLSLPMMLLICSINSEANERPQKEYLEPEAVKVVDVSGNEFVCYKPKDGVTVARIFVDYHTLWSYALSLEQEKKTFKTEISLLEKKAYLWEYTAVEMKERGDLYLESFKSENEALMKMSEDRYKKQKWAWLPWSLTAVVAIAFGVTAFALK